MLLLLFWFCVFRLFFFAFFAHFFVCVFMCFFCFFGFFIFFYLEPNWHLELKWWKMRHKFDVIPSRQPVLAPTIFCLFCTSILTTVSQPPLGTGTSNFHNKSTKAGWKKIHFFFSLMSKNCSCSICMQKQTEWSFFKNPTKR